MLLLFFFVCITCSGIHSSVQAMRDSTAYSSMSRLSPWPQDPWLAFTVISWISGVRQGSGQIYVIYYRSHQIVSTEEYIYKFPGYISWIAETMGSVPPENMVMCGRTIPPAFQICYYLQVPKIWYEVKMVGMNAVRAVGFLIVSCWLSISALQGCTSLVN
jgi:hypothetical protein